MKKWTLIFISLVLAVVCLTGCSKDEDSSDNKIVQEKEASKDKTVEKGEIITFGRYEQDNYLDNGPEDIEWIVLDVQDGKALLLSKYALDTKPYNTEGTDITWEQCTLRTWLNDDFMNEAFSEKEQSAILTTNVDNSKAQGYRRYATGGEDTKDQIFLLSYHEAFDLYFTNDEARKCVPTDYAAAKGALTISEYNLDGCPTGAWWLRSPGARQYSAATVDYRGDRNWSLVELDFYVVRPALWVDLQSIPESSSEEIDSVAQTEEISQNEKSVAKGDVITFGRYEQDNNRDNGEEPIKWIVLDVQDGKALLLSKYGLDAKPFNAEKKDITWEQCTLRTWLNRYFLNAAFSEKEQSAILTTYVDNSKAQGYNGHDKFDGIDTEDQIFLLSYHEAYDLYLTSDEARICEATKYAMANGAIAINSDQLDGRPAGSWWLRLTRNYSYSALNVLRGGSISLDDVSTDYNVVRPALWIDLEFISDSFSEKNDSAIQTGELFQNEKSVAIGDVITFGCYEQDNNLDNGPEDIEWIVLDVQDGKALLISKYGLDVKLYNTERTDITWEQCTLRTWLNDDFMNEAFSEKEQSAILTTHVDNSKAQGYSGYDTTGGNNTEDQIFLLSYHESFDLYFTDDEARMCAPTDYAVANGAWNGSSYQLNGRRTGAWWLRSPGYYQNLTTYVDSDGSRNNTYVNRDHNIVRPALWVNLESGT